MANMVSCELNLSCQAQSPPPPPTAEEMCAAEGLLMLSLGPHPPLSSQKSTKIRIKVRIKKIKEPSSRSPTSTLPHVCNECGVSFSSSQALGGHKTSHRPRVTPSSARGSADQLHECSHCPAQFPSGQALGGHQRKHYEGFICAPGKNKSRKFNDDASDEDDGAGPRPTRRRLDIDLNEPYVPNNNFMEEE